MLEGVLANFTGEQMPHFDLFDGQRHSFGRFQLDGLGDLILEIAHRRRGIANRVAASTRRRRTATIGNAVRARRGRIVASGMAEHARRRCGKAVGDAVHARRRCFQLLDQPACRSAPLQQRRCRSIRMS